MKNKSWAEFKGNGIYCVKITLVLDRAITIQHNCLLKKITDPVPELIFTGFLEMTCTNCKEAMILTEEKYATGIAFMEAQEAERKSQRKAILSALSGEFFTTPVQDSPGANV